MTRTRLHFALSLILTALMGCHSDAPKAPAAIVSPQPTNALPDPTNQDCAAISDAALAEDCRFRKEVEAAKKKHNSNPVVKHSPGSIQQP